MLGYGLTEKPRKETYTIPRLAEFTLDFLTTQKIQRAHFAGFSLGFQNGRSEMILGLLYKIKKKRALAVQHLTEGKRILAQFGQTPMLARVETALAELGQ